MEWEHRVVLWCQHPWLRGKGHPRLTGSSRVEIVGSSTVVGRKPCTVEGKVSSVYSYLPLGWADHGGSGGNFGGWGGGTTNG